MVEWDQFLVGLKKILNDVKEDEQKVLQYILDNSNTGCINQHKFSEFLKGFGPIQDCVKNVKSTLSSKWFYGFLSRYETDLLLRDQMVGTFLIRLSSSAPGSFALAFSTLTSNGEKTTCHILINSCKPLGFQVHEQESHSARTFQTLYELVDFYSVFLQTPFNSDFVYESWFEGDYSSSETNEVLSGHKPGTFIVRFSSQLGSYAVSFVASDGQINHSLIDHEGVPNGGYRIVNDGQPLVFASLKEVVHHYGDTLKFPLKTLANEAHVDVGKHIMDWKLKRAKQVDQVVNDLFAPTKAMPPMDNKNAEASTETNAKVQEIMQRLFAPLL